jgi:hypothetical protein
VDISSKFIGDGFCIVSLTEGNSRGMVEDWVPARIVRLSVDRRVRADLATFGSKLKECKKTENRKNQ